MNVHVYQEQVVTLVLRCRPGLNDDSPHSDYSESISYPQDPMFTRVLVRTVILDENY